MLLRFAVKAAKPERIFMYHTDYHLHSKYSFDGCEEVFAICERAILNGLNEIAITDHLDIVESSPYDHEFDVKNAYKDIEKAKRIYSKKLIIKTGVELGQPQANPAEYKRFFNDFHPDFVIGSIHNMENDEDLYYYDWNTRDEFEFFDAYIKRMTVLARDYDYDILGHVTYPLRYIYEARLKPFPLERYHERFKELFKIAIQRGKGIECNTSGLIQPIGETLPPLSLLKLYKECGGEIITIGSDAHRIENISKGIKTGEDLIKEAGFKYICTYENRKPVFRSI